MKKIVALLKWPSAIIKILVQKSSFDKKATTAAGFEPTREFPNAFRVHRLNHSARQPSVLVKTKYL
jgi:hypothetical protein